MYRGERDQFGWTSRTGKHEVDAERGVKLKGPLPNAEGRSCRGPPLRLFRPPGNGDGLPVTDPPLRPAAAPPPRWHAKSVSGRGGRAADALASQGLGSLGQARHRGQQLRGLDGLWQVDPKLAAVAFTRSSTRA